ncbi:MAG: hypothetical protein ABIG90_00580 [bacterium]
MTKFSNKTDKPYNLEERTAKFGEQIIDFVRKIRKDEINRDIIRQLIRSATSIGCGCWQKQCLNKQKDAESYGKKHTSST